MGIFEKILRGIGTVLHSLLVLVILVLLAGTVVFQGAALLQDTDAPTLLGWRVAAVRDPAMAPALAEGSLVLLRQQESYSAGDLVATTDENGPFFGRVTFCFSGKCTLGNAQATAVRATGVRVERILGAVALQIPHAGAVLAWTSSTTGLVVLIVAGILVADLPKWISGKYDPEDYEDEEEYEEG